MSSNRLRCIFNRIINTHTFIGQSRS
jgi:hypothetical protein